MRCKIPKCPSQEPRVHTSSLITLPSVGQKVELCVAGGANGSWHGQTFLFQGQFILRLA